MTPLITAFISMCITSRLLVAVPDAEPGHALWHQAEKAYHSGQYSKAAEIYFEIAEKHAGLQQAIARFNHANASHMMGSLRQAADAYRAVLQDDDHTDMPLKTAALFNNGNTLAGLAEGHNDKSLQAEILQEALDNYRQLLIISPGDDKARINYEIIYRRLHASPSEQNRKPAPETSAETPSERMLKSAARKERTELGKARPPLQHLPSGVPTKPW
ncbi:MAG TPA: hypothetical protein ENN50_03260 [Prosthecochloris aestuarii]|uniref:Uncharacterized protein n=1 Tax=Prosthecochloris aestuarii TaxID=1102 RepID=A0A831SRK3_PROAE|nr:hypothetical protein [Prosthecochloris sp.]HED30708.1 hypothetical protein [Prosthecochloris aestuarii]